MKNTIIVGIIMLLFSCSSKEQATIFWVNSYKVDCVGVGPMKCMLIQKREALEDGAWQNFYSKIEGFEYEPGFIYKLKVKEEELENVPADASSIKYTLVEVLEKKQDVSLRLNDIWALSELEGERVDNQNTGELPYIEIHIAEGKVMGTDGCNNFTGAIKMVSESILEFGPLAGTRKMCPDMTLADKFNKAISRIRNYKIANLELTLLDENGEVLLVMKKVD